MKETITQTRPCRQVGMFRHVSCGNRQGGNMPNMEHENVANMRTREQETVQSLVLTVGQSPGQS